MNNQHKKLNYNNFNKIYKFVDGDIYEGYFINNLFEGNGVNYYSAINKIKK